MSSIQSDPFRSLGPLIHSTNSDPFRSLGSLNHSTNSLDPALVFPHHSPLTNQILWRKHVSKTHNRANRRHAVIRNQP